MGESQTTKKETVSKKLNKWNFMFICHTHSIVNSMNVGTVTELNEIKQIKKS